MEITFSHDMNTTVTADKLNSTYIDIHIIPYSSGFEDEQRDVNLTWNVTFF